RDQSVKRERLVERARHQGLEDVSVHPLRGGAGLQVKRIETIEGAEESDGEATAFHRGWLGIGQMIEGILEGRVAVHGDGGRGNRGWRHGFRREGGTKTSDMKK